MTLRKKRIPVVLDTNVIVGYYLSHSIHSSNARVIRLWRDQRKLQLIVSLELTTEYLGVLSQLNVKQERVRRFAERLRHRDTVTAVRLGARSAISRDPDDNLLLATAAVGKAKFLITNDLDLLEIPAKQMKKFRFKIVSPSEFLQRLKPSPSV